MKPSDAQSKNTAIQNETSDAQTMKYCNLVRNLRRTNKEVLQYSAKPPTHKQRITATDEPP